MTFVKGKGWIEETGITMKCGTVVRLEHRPPVAGERYFYTDARLGGRWGGYVPASHLEDGWEAFVAQHAYKKALWAGGTTRWSDVRRWSRDEYWTLTYDHP